MLNPPPINPFELSTYDVIWNTPSHDAAGSMPIGNGEVVLNVWAEDKTGDLLILIARTDAISEISRILKLGRVRIHLNDSPFRNATDFVQRLDLRNGVIHVSARGSQLKIFVDSGSHVIHVRGKLARPTTITAALESWRNTARELPKAEYASAWSAQNAPFPLIESVDVITNKAGSLAFFHHNESSIVPKIWENQSLTDAPGRFDPLQNLTFGGLIRGIGFESKGSNQLVSKTLQKSFDLSITTLTAVANSGDDWLREINAITIAPSDTAEKRTRQWWNAFWDRSHVFISAPTSPQPVPENKYVLRIGVDSNGQNQFPGDISTPESQLPSEANHQRLVLSAVITPKGLKPGRIFDKLTAGQSDGFLFDTHPGNGLRLIVGDMTLVAPSCLVANKSQRVRADYNGQTGEASIYLNDVRVAHRLGADPLEISRGYVLQRYVQACQGRGKYPIKFNGGYFSVEPSASGMAFDPDWRRWGDCFWYQNTRHMYHPMLATGDFDMMAPFFRLYKDAIPLGESRSRIYHGAEGAYFPETMTHYGTYGGQDYGWDRTGLQPKDVQCPWWDDAWNQGPELLQLMLDYYDFTQDQQFLNRQLIPTATSILKYFDTRFKKDDAGRVILDPTQVVETYWTGVVNDMPSVSGLIAVTHRLAKLPGSTPLFRRLAKQCPELPLETKAGQRKLAPAQKYDPTTSNVENGELYAVWPFRLVSLASPKLLNEAKAAYAQRLNHLDNGWGYDGNAAALLGLTDEAARILAAKSRNSSPAYRWPATWGPNFDWLPDQNHGGNLLNTTNLMLMQAEGNEIRIFPAWPKAWDVSFRLHAPHQTIVEAELRNGAITRIHVTPASRRKDVILPTGLSVAGH